MKNLHSKSDVTIAADIDTLLLNADKNNKRNRIDQQNYKNQFYLSTKTSKKTKYYQTRHLNNNSSGKPLPTSNSDSRPQYPPSNNFRGRSSDRRNSQYFSQSCYSRPNSQTNQHRKI